MRQISPICTLLVALLLICGVPLRGQPATGGQVAGVVVDAHGQPLAGVFISGPAGWTAITTASGKFMAPVGVELQFKATGFVTASATLHAEQTARVVMNPAGPQQSITVTAYRTPLPTEDSPASVRILTAQDMQQSASISLDDKLREVAGTELFRRSSSRVANPTSQGISLRGLGSTAASRTLVVADDVPQNDPFGGWIHWQEMPQLAIQSVEVVRGGASDLYGSSAIGGVINMIPVHPSENSATALASYGGQNTSDLALQLTGVHSKWAALASMGFFNTDGFILVAPDARGAVDVPSTLQAENGLVFIGHHSGSTALFLRGTGFNEERGNGTPLQINNTRLWRYSGGLEWGNHSGGTLGVTLYGATEHYGQTFSAIGPNRNTEVLTRYAQTPTSELGAVSHWQQTFGKNIVVIAGGDVLDVRAEDHETLYPTLRVTDVSDRQRQSGLYAEGLWTPGRWTLTAGLRVDFFRNFDAVQYPPGAAPLPQLSENVVDPRVGVVRRIGPVFALTASAFRAFRAPTPNELYRNGQVGQEITLANPRLQAERATGWEAGSQVTLSAITVRGSYFWTQVNRPITALTLASTPNAVLKQRENLGQIESRGVSVDFESTPRPWLSLGGGYQFADATVTQAPQNADLEGNWIPQVPRNMATFQASLHSARMGTLSLQMRTSGPQYDDDANQYRLNGFFRLDARFARGFGGNDGHRYEVFATAENLTDQPMQVGRTPVLTLGTPLVGNIGLRWNLSGSRQ